jgi:hypothetical protein
VFNSYPAERSDMTPDQLAMLQHLIATSGGDAIFRPSSASGWMACHGRVQLSAKVPRGGRSSSYAQEGTAAHIVFNQALSSERQPSEWTDRMVRIDDMTGVFVDEEMVECIDWCVDKVADLMGGDPDVEMFLEYKLSLEHLDPTDPLLQQNRGTGDVVLFNRAKRWLKIVDLKYGKGVPVPSDSPQLLDYGIMGLVTWDVSGGWESIESIVLQPRITTLGADYEDAKVTIKDGGRYKAVRLDPSVLLTDFLGRVVGAMEAALAPNPPLVTGDHCRWCPATPICPAVRAAALSIADDAHGSPVTAMTVTALMGPIPPVPPLRDARTLSGADIATILDRRGVFNAWIESVEQMAARLVEVGGHVPGYGLRSRSGHRKFKDEAAATKVLTTTGGLKAEQLLTEPKLRSPAQIEKLLPPSKRKLVDANDKTSLVEKPEGALQLVRLKGDELLQSTKPKLSALPVEATQNA